MPLPVLRAESVLRTVPFRKYAPSPELLTTVQLSTMPPSRMPTAPLLPLLYMKVQR